MGKSTPPVVNAGADGSLMRPDLYLLTESGQIQDANHDTMCILLEVLSA